MTRRTMIAHDGRRAGVETDPEGSGDILLTMRASVLHGQPGDAPGQELYIPADLAVWVARRLRNAVGLTDG